MVARAAGATGTAEVRMARRVGKASTVGKASMVGKVVGGTMGTAVGSAEVVAHPTAALTHTTAVRAEGTAVRAQASAEVLHAAVVKCLMTEF